jgi:signal transduction histidine kinase
VKRKKDLNLQLVDAKISFSSKSFQKIMIELLDNAFKFSQPGQAVRVVATIKDRHFIVHVIDQGCGMNEEQIAHIGDFAHSEENWYDQQGPGMGLLLARMLIELHGGKLSIKSMLNQQTSVTVVLPDVISME